MELDEHINYFFDKDNRLKLNLTRKINKKYPNIKEYLLNKYEYVENLSEAIIRIKYNIDKRPVCPICGGKLKYVGSKGYLGNYTQFYIPHCSIKCSKKDKETIRKYKETCLEKYGVENPSQAKEVKDKKKDTTLLHYGVENPSQAKEVKDKKKETTLLHYGVENPLQSEEIKEKRKKTCTDKYGTDNVFKSNLFKQKSVTTWLKKYGVENPSQAKEVKDKKKETTLLHYGVKYPGQSEEIKKKISNTVMKRYGVKWITSSIDFINKSRDTMYKKYGCIQPMHNEEIVNKMLETKRRNNSFHTSKPEEELYLYIKEKFPSVIRQYKDKERYPFCCDFYIQELDLFMELNGTWTHGKHPYIQDNPEDQHILNHWIERSKEHPFYITAILTWTEADVKKRNTAKKNNLNFKEVWSLEEGKEYIDKIYIEKNR